LCGPARTDLADPSICGAFKVPSLRNVAITGPYSHNSRFQTHREVVDFYVTRDTNPERWYPGVNKLDDLPPQYRANVNTEEVPYDGRPGESPRLNAEEIDALVAFLGTLTDGFAGSP
jgi:cytochrome c peroxidase